ncbi:flagellar basal body-associated protein FliL [Paenibacillus shirakamiensis]|uniref:Flagellar basal body-associated protein FliL n=1 Tax=Paenibacillus shirakamiensis TaxID=1265935 RepID=A0ABS4JHV2_9BACL|nr:hypothetical protein [Paenibacillus shirakamiensis]MBP2001297.1 flagellar basal body-associated protein FliL [Paenibacillus shirakamiensis]
MKKKMVMTMLICMLVLVLAPIAAYAAVSSNTAQGQGELYVSGYVANLHGGDLILKETATGAVVYSHHYNDTNTGSVVKENITGSFPNLPSGTYQLTWTGPLGGSFSIHF